MSLILLEFQNRLLKVNVGLSFWYLVLCCLESANFAGLFVKNKGKQVQVVMKEMTHNKNFLHYEEESFICLFR